MLQDSVLSLLQRAADPATVEILVAFDPDDPSATEAGGLLAELPSVRVIYAPERYGYPRLHDYYNMLAAEASGEWLLIWNDDVTMSTQGWDSVVAGRPPALLWPYCPQDVGEDVFPFFPAAWIRHLGHVGMSFCVNAWLHEVAEMLPGRIHHIPVCISHGRPDDDTHRTASRIPHEARNLHNTELMQQAKRDDAAKICALTGDTFGNTELVSVLLPGTGASSVIRQLLDKAAQPDEVEFLVAGGRDHKALRASLEEAGVMGHTECHSSRTTAEIRRWCHGRWVRELGSFDEDPAWDNGIRATG